MENHNRSCAWATLFEVCDEVPTHEIDFKWWGPRLYCQAHCDEMLGDGKSKTVKRVREL
ncbi:hypothetical protein BJD55_gp110 [Gordonia phage Yvonnetastic]|uniref:Uncharacterized protein n=1 Tax=Gordonia phage Yvonnetastic TaxID=1821566 RepID=A0A142K973_9CAUD|nr:hypothetical protein BJD55_gp110 [Gordonia phage Yvonnetastic]AMS02656.1 hypothetical protein SEA_YVONNETASTIC_112 [Gordonia phage Yvonnetastic]